MNESLAVTILRRAKELMNHDGLHWYQGDSQSAIPRADGEYAYCSIGALEEIEERLNSEFGNERRCEIRDARLEAEGHLAYIIEEVLSAEDIVSFNDHPERQWPDIANAFDLAIRRGKGEYVGR